MDNNDDGILPIRHFYVRTTKKIRCLILGGVSKEIDRLEMGRTRSDKEKPAAQLRRRPDWGKGRHGPV